MTTLIILKLILVISTTNVAASANNVSQKFNSQIKKQTYTLQLKAKKQAATLELAKRKAYLRNQNYAPSGSFNFNVNFEDYLGLDLSSQALVAYKDKKPVLKSLVSTGIAQFPTPVGIFRIRSKIISQTMRGYYGPGSPYNYYLPGVPNVMYFYGDDALHGTYWHNNFGTPMSHGCVNLPLWVARWVYENYSIGTPVVIQY